MADLMKQISYNFETVEKLLTLLIRVGYDIVLTTDKGISRKIERKMNALEDVIGYLNGYDDWNRHDLDYYGYSNYFENFNIKYDSVPKNLNYWLIDVINDTMEFMNFLYKYKNSIIKIQRWYRHKYYSPNGKGALKAKLHFLKVMEQ